jgi:tripartite-type tricarboxylate transporter receptor subunit TctC
MRALASLGADRAPAYPEVPSLKELGYDVEYYLWQGPFRARRDPLADNQDVAGGGEESCPDGGVQDRAPARGK